MSRAKAKRPKAAEARPEPASAAPVMQPQKPAVARKQAAQPEHVHKYRPTPAGQKCDDCGHEPHLDRRASNVPFVVAGFDAHGKPTVREIFPDGHQEEASTGNDTKGLLSRWASWRPR